MVNDPGPVDGTLWGQYVRAGHERWEVVRRSWSIFVRNTHELLCLLTVSTSDAAVSVLMSDDREATKSFWEELDQRLHNELASAVTLVDHTRRLMDYYLPHVPAFVEEYEKRNSNVTELDETAFLRDLRNYLLHYGVPPVIQTLDLAPHEAGTGHSIKLSAGRLLDWDRWNSRSRNYLRAFEERDGPDLHATVAGYANGMSALFLWLFEQRSNTHNDPQVLDRFRIDSSLKATSETVRPIQIYTQT